MEMTVENRSRWEGAKLASTVAGVCAQRALLQPNDLAFAFLDDHLAVRASLSYRELYARAQAIAAAIEPHRKGSDTTVLLLFAPGLAYIEAFLGCLMAGDIAVPAYPIMNMKDFKRLSAIATDCDASLVLTSKEFLGPINLWLQQNNLQGVNCLATNDLALPDETVEAGLAELLETAGSDLPVGPLPGENDIAFLQYTSGSTGDPKGVMVTQQNLMHNLGQIYQCFGHSADSRGVIWLPPYHDMGLIGGILQPLYGGFPVYLMSPFTFLKQPKRWLEAVSKYRATTSGGPNFAFELVMKYAGRFAEDLDLSSWSVAFSGAEPIRKKTIERFCEAFTSAGFRPEAVYPCYGLAESTLIASGGRPFSPLVSRHVDAQALTTRQLQPLEDVSEAGPAGAQELVSCGTQLDNEIFIVDPQSGQRMADGQIGEIWLRGPSIARGYWRRDDLNESLFGAMTQCGQGPFLRTGDLGGLLDGELYVTGRIKELIIVNGQNHYPTDIEFTVQERHGDHLKKGCGAAFSHMVEGLEHLILAQELRKEAIADCDFTNLESSIKSAIFEGHRLNPHAVVLLPPGAIPKTSSGKLKRTEVKRLFAEGLLQDIRLA